MSGILQNERLGLAFQYFGMAVLSVALVKLAMRLANNIGTFFFGTGAVDFKKYGSWSVITGATDGIGKAYAEQLAKRGQNIVLISRTLAKLEQLAKELEDTYKVKTLVIAADFTEPNSIYEDIKIKVKDLDIGVLINNVGMSYANPEYFDILAKENPEMMNSMINANIMSVTKMTAIVLPTMLAKKKGIIINNASSSGRAPTAFLAMYSASKAYVDFFSRALASEYEDKGIIVQSICPFFVATKLAKIKKSSMMAPSPTSFVCSALKTIGTQRVSNGCIPHQLQGWAVESLAPEAVYNSITNDMMKKSRAAAYRKRARQAAEAEATNKE